MHTPASAPINVGPFLTPFYVQPTENGIQWLTVSFGARLQISEGDIRNSSRYLIRTNRGLFPLDLSEQAASPTSPLQQVILSFVPGSGDQTFLRCSYHYPERTREVTLKRFTGSLASLKPRSSKCLHINLTEDASSTASVQPHSSEKPKTSRDLSATSVQWQASGPEFKTVGGTQNKRYSKNPQSQPPAHSWMKTGLLTAGGITLALLAAAAWMKKKGMTGN